MDAMEHTASFTGHRPGKAGMAYLPDHPDSESLTKLFDHTVQMLVEKHGVDMFLCGMADGFDLFAAQRLLWLKRAGRIPQSVCLIAVQPFPDHFHTIRKERWQDAYQEVLQCAQDALVVSDAYSADAYRRRNAYLVDHARYVVAYWNHAVRSGTGQTVRMALKADRSVINLFDLL